MNSDWLLPKTMAAIADRPMEKAKGTPTSRKAAKVTKRTAIIM